MTKKPTKKHEYMDFDPFKLIILPQVRKVMMKEPLEELKDSLEFDGQINAINVARLTEKQFQKHLDFINGVWKREVKIQDYKPYNGHYYIVIAGHRRLTGIRSLEWETCEIKRHFIHDSKDILRIQLAENTYAGIKVEERAIAIIENYRYDILTGKVLDKEDFIRQNQAKFSRRVLHDALAFADLPVEVQEYIFNNNIHYAVGVELGKLKPLIVKYETDQLPEQEQVDEAKLDKSLAWHFAGLCIKLQNAKSVKRGMEMLRNHQTHLEDYFRPSDVVQQELMDWFNTGPDRQYEAHIARLKKDFNDALSATNSNVAKDFISLLNAHSNLTGADLSEDKNFIRKLLHEYVMNAEYREENGLMKRKK